MLFANVYNAFDAFYNGDVQTVGNILNTIYGANSSIQDGNTTIPWNADQITNTTYLNNFLNTLSNQSLTVLGYDVLGKILGSYGLLSPSDSSQYQMLLNMLGDEQPADDGETMPGLDSILFDRFIISAMAYIVSCVVDIV
jgi:hypothetical protein